MPGHTRDECVSHPPGSQSQTEPLSFGFLGHYSFFAPTYPSIITKPFCRRNMFAIRATGVDLRNWACHYPIIAGAGSARMSQKYNQST